MLNLPDEIIDLIQPFAMLFHFRTWRKAQILLIGAILSPGKRTVSSALRVMGFSEAANFATYHHVLNRARWSPLELSQVLLGLLIRYLAPYGPLVFGMDETVERRRGKRISAKGIYRDGVRSSKGHFVKASGLRWISLMYLAHIPFAERIWALPFLTVLAPSERYYQKLGRPHKKLTHWATQMVSQLRRWLPDRYLVVVADSSYAVLDLLKFCQSMTQPVTFITRLRLDAALHEPPPPRRPGQRGRSRVVGMRLPAIKSLLDEPTTCWMSVTVNWYDSTIRELQIASDTALWYNRGKGPVPLRWVLIRDPFNQFKPQALLCTDINVEATQIIEWFVMRWQLEVTFQEVRTHLGVETQRQWSDLAIARTTPLLFGLFSWVTLAAHLAQSDPNELVGSAAWYDKPLPTFSDAIASVRRTLWPASAILCMSDSDDDLQIIPRALLDRMVHTLCYAA
jgi:hypothetical protein